MLSTCTRFQGSKESYVGRSHVKFTRVRIIARPRVLARAAPDTDTREEAEIGASRTCQHCGVALEDVPFGCDQEGHKAGGMGALFEWWPVKAWGPCPKASEAGLPYTRKGQGTNEMLFGPDSDRMS
jgi:hypothetical protein